MGGDGVKRFIAIAVIIALGSIGWDLGSQYSPMDSDTGARVGAFVGVVFGLLIFLAMRARG